MEQNLYLYYYFFAPDSHVKQGMSKKYRLRFNKFYEGDTGSNPLLTRTKCRQNVTIRLLYYYFLNMQIIR